MVSSVRVYEKGDQGTMVSSVRVYEKGDQGTTNQEGHLLLRNTKKVKDSHKVILEGEAT